MGMIFSLVKLAPIFFVNSLLTMVFVNIVDTTLGIAEIDYVQSMLVTISLWIVVAPIALLVSRMKFSETQTW